MTTENQIIPQLCSQALANGNPSQGDPLSTSVPDRSGGYRRRPDAEPSQPDRTSALVRGLALILRHHDASELVVDSMLLQMHQYLDSSPSEMVWLKRAKYALTFPLAKYLRNELPPIPDLEFVPSGLLRGWMKPRLCFFNRKNTHLWFSWLQGKRCSLPASSSFVHATYAEHRDSLTSPDEGDEELISEMMNDRTFVRLLGKIRSQIDKLHRFTNFDSMNPTTSACLERTRNSGGQIGELCSYVGLPLGDKDKLNEDGTIFNEMDDDENWDMPGKSMIGPPDEDGECGVDEVPQEYESILVARYLLTPSNQRGRSDLHSMSYHPVVIHSDGTRSYNVVLESRIPYGYEAWKGLWTMSREIPLDRPLACCIQAVLEPFKVRVISKGEALPYYAVRPLQRIMHDTMRSMPCFRLIGRPFCAADVVDLTRRAEPGFSWFNVDYSAATDNLSWKLSSRILQFLIQDLSPYEQSLAIQALGPHQLFYPENKSGPSVPEGLMARGQLMGSILSFPILCLANLAIYLRVTADCQSSWKDKDRLGHVLVNGDDMLYSADPSLWPVHVDIARRVGMKMSKGKSYLSSLYWNINSTSGHYNLSRLNLGETPWKVDYLNVGLFFDQHKIQGSSSRESDGSSLKPISSVCTNLEKILEGSLPGKQSSLLKLFLAENREKVVSECRFFQRGKGVSGFRQRNLFLPRALGGMGVVPPPGWRYTLTTTDKYLAGSRLSLVHGTTFSRAIPAEGYLLNEIDPIRSVPWLKPAESSPPPEEWVGNKATRRIINSTLVLLQHCDRPNTPTFRCPRPSLDCI